MDALVDAQVLLLRKALTARWELAPERLRAEVDVIVRLEPNAAFEALAAAFVGAHELPLVVAGYSLRLARVMRLLTRRTNALLRVVIADIVLTADQRLVRRCFVLLRNCLIDKRKLGVQPLETSSGGHGLACRVHGRG